MVDTKQYGVNLIPLSCVRCPAMQRTMRQTVQDVADIKDELSGRRAAAVGMQVLCAELLSWHPVVVSFSLSHLTRC